MCLNRYGNQVRVGFVSLTVALCLASVVCADDVSWIAGVSNSANWSIRPEDPNEGEIIEFSGATHTYLNQCIAERAFGGKPALQVDAARREVQLVFVPPAGDQCTTFWSPVCGLRGSFGPLAAGSWVFFCTQGGATFSLPFEVQGGTRRTVYYVDSQAVGIRNGSSWADAFIYLQNALAVAREDSEIRVARGVYRPTDGLGPGIASLEASFALPAGVVLKGGYAGANNVNPFARDIVAWETVLSGDLKGNDDLQVRRRGMVGHPTRSDNSHHVVTAIGADVTVTLDGFTIQGGNAAGPDGVDSLGCGAGIYIDSANLTLRGCTIVNNAAAYYGGGVYSRGVCNVTFADCTIADNWSEWRGGGLHKDWGTRIHMERCLISGNATVYDGGGIVNNTDAELTLANCVLSGNLCTGVDSGRGGGIYCFLAAVRLNHCTFVSNSAAVGAGMACVYAEDSQTSVAGLSNCILWDRGDSLWANVGFLPKVTYSDVQGGWTGEGNRNVDPRFLDRGSWDVNGTPTDPSDDIWQDGDYRLSYESPCIDAGDPASQPDSSETDMDGGRRLIGKAVDMGAYELFDERPVADAGDDTTVPALDGKTGAVTLDGSGSQDPSGLELYYRWYRDGKPVSTAVRVTIGGLPVGQHTFTLFVSNSAGLSRSDEVVVTVKPVDVTVAVVSPGEIDRRRTDTAIIAMVVMPKGKGPGDFDVSEPMLLFPPDGGAKAQSQTTLVWLDGRVFAMARFDAAALLAAVPGNGPVELRIVGRLKNGQYFGGVDTVKIK